MKLNTTSGRIRSLSIRVVLGVLLVGVCGLRGWAQTSGTLSHPNTEAIKQIKVADPNDFTFVFLGDNKGSGALFEEMLRGVNKEKAAAFVIDDGDLVPNGKQAEFTYFLDQIQKNLTLPLVVAPGNHEVKSSGEALYNNIFGPGHYSFRVGKTAILMADDASEKIDDAEAQWLTDELKAAADCTNRLVVLHVPPFDPRGGNNHHCLDDASAKRLMEILKAGKASYIFAGHIHLYFKGEWDGIPYVISGGAGASLVTKDPEHGFYHYLVVHVAGDKIEYQVRKVNEPAGTGVAKTKTKKAKTKAQSTASAGN